MNSFQKKLNECTKCPFEDYDINWYDEKTGCGKLGAYWKEGSDKQIMVVGQNPSHVRWKGAHAMQGKQGDPFKKIFGEDHLVFSNFIQISTPDNKVDKLTNQEILHCLEHLVFEIKHLKPKILIICSMFARKKLVELDKLSLLNRMGTQVFFVKHPDYYLTYNKGNIEEYYQELEEIKNLTEYLQIY